LTQTLVNLKICNMNYWLRSLPSGSGANTNYGTRSCNNVNFIEYISIEVKEMHCTHYEFEGGTFPYVSWHYHACCALSCLLRRPAACCSNLELAVEAQSALPFQLTSAQQVALGEVLQDMGATTGEGSQQQQQQKPMYRLLQGDVGSGKTVVAMLAMLAAAGSGGRLAGLVGSCESWKAQSMEVWKARVD
jgi:hypothetical protein